ncbi:RnfABCDGE type electron transport complex subunit G [Halosquirtibacter xylanolyticus]|uniref:RnfABCDGE type electron transport complex subunit G n=1 Tax=Halosquirtibacter xylanolyticus TaxID=3374599 RepID=UPI003748D11E|nr:RnfABCDGE type electron transport complex subunit G [Prolixibacteraceae bacterium]
MAKIASNFKNMVITLFVVTMGSGAILGLMNQLTADAITKSQVKAQEEAIASVLPKFDKLGDSYKTIVKGDKDSLEVFPALDAQGALVGHAIKTFTNNGFSGHIDIMVGFDKENKISGFQVLLHQETPGLGSKMQEWFSTPKEGKKNSIIGLDPTKTKMTVSKDGGDIDAITAATISSRAFLDAVSRATKAIANDKSADGVSGASKQHKEKEGGKS